MLTTPGINVETGEYEDLEFSNYFSKLLRDHRVVPEKNDLNLYYSY